MLNFTVLFGHIKIDVYPCVPLSTFMCMHACTHTNSTCKYIGDTTNCQLEIH